MKFKLLQKVLQESRIELPKSLKDLNNFSLENGNLTTSHGHQEEIKKLFPNTFSQPIVKIKNSIKNESDIHNAKRVGVVLSGGQAPGGHNVIAGLYDALKKMNSKSILFGFLNGPSGILENKTLQFDIKIIDSIRNQGGFDVIGSGRTKIESSEQLKLAHDTANALNLDGIVVIGGDDSNTNAAVLAEYFIKSNCKTVVVGVPKTIDGDLKNEHVEVSFGHHSACKLYSELIGNILRDTISSKKHYHFIRLMGRSASHIALECAMQTHANITIIGEEVEEKKQTLKEITNDICDIICERSEIGKNYGVVLIPEGLIEFIPEIKILIEELNSHLTQGSENHKKINSAKTYQEKIDILKIILSNESYQSAKSLPNDIVLQLLLDRDPHGNIQIAQIDTEVLLIETVQKELERRSIKNFTAMPHYFGYEGRALYPTYFDAHYCYSLGYVAAILIDNKLTGYMSSVSNLADEVKNWTTAGAPITMFMNLEKRHNKDKPVIKKALVDLSSNFFKEFSKSRDSWMLDDDYIYSGPIQFFYNDEESEQIVKDRPICLEF